MIIIGLICAIIGFLLGIQLLWVIGLVVLLIGLCLLAFGYAGHPVGRRSHWW